MTETPILSYRQITNALQRAGFVVVRQRGSHIRLQKTPKGEELRFPGTLLMSKNPPWLYSQSTSDSGVMHGKVNNTILLAQLRNEAEGEKQKIAEAQQGLLRLEEQIKATEVILPLARHNGQQIKFGVYDTLLIKLKEDKGRVSQVDALQMIPKENGKFKVTQTARLMVEAGFISNPKNAQSITYTLIGRSEKFEKIGLGEYKLVGAQ